jgi:sporulation protein YlmC with PRC-barrel domain
MRIGNPKELVGKEVYDAEGNTVGYIDKTWYSWNQEHPGYFFGIRTTQNVRDSYFRGTYKLITIYSDYIKDVGQGVTLNKTMDDLYHFWSKTVQCGQKTYPTDKLVEMPVYDKNYSRIGTFFATIESEGPSTNYGVLVDPYLCDTWNKPQNTLMPIPTNYITEVKDTITLDKTLDELRAYWKEHYNY